MGRQKRKEKKKPPSDSPTIDKNQSYTDFLCPICLQILIEPVQMPCQHELCMECFKMHVENTSLQCPMCRLRISVWVRKNTKTNTLVNLQRWELIKSLFPERVARRLNGEEDLESSYNEYNAPKHVIANVGELRKEYEDEMKKLKEERDKQAQANMEYIQKLQVEDAEARKRQEALDAAEAEALQKEEMKNLGVTLKSPSSHQKALLALWKPKSPMKLRGDKLVHNQINKKSSSKITSPNHTITTFFKPAFQESNKSSSVKTTGESKLNLTSNNNTSCCSKNPTIPSYEGPILTSKDDFQFAKKLQEQFNMEMDLHCGRSKVKEPLKRKNSLSPEQFTQKLRAKRHVTGGNRKSTQENCKPAIS